MGANPDQPVSAFVWPDEIPSVAEWLQKHSFYNNGESKEPVFGSGVPLVRQVMMKADSVRQVLETL